MKDDFNLNLAKLKVLSDIAIQKAAALHRVIQGLPYTPNTNPANKLAGHGVRLLLNTVSPKMVKQLDDLGLKLG